jgi:5'-nucleotidase
MRYPIPLVLVLLLAACSGASRPPQRGEPAPTSSGPAGGFAQPGLGQANGKYDQLVIVGTNDFHGYLRPIETEFGGQKIIQGGAEWFAGYVDILQRKFGERLILLDAGDMYQGTIESNPFHGRSVEAYYNLLPYRALALGNHEFDYGPDSQASKDMLGAIKARMAESTHPFVQANIFLKKTGKLWQEKNLFSSVLVNAGPYKVGIIGLTTTSTPGKTTPSHVADFEFREFAVPASAEAKRLRAAGADFVFVTTHEGDGTQEGDPISVFLKAIPPGTIDALVAGHSHTESHQMVHGVPVIESKTRGLFFGRIDLFVNKETHKIEPSLTHIHEMHGICGTWFKNEERCGQKEAKDEIASGKFKQEDFLPLRPATYEGEMVKPSLAVREVLAPYFAKADTQRNEVVGEAKADFEWYPSGENQMGTLIIDSFRERFPEAKVIYMNGGGIRRRLFKGPITYGDLYEVSPFDNVAVLVKMSGAQLKELVKVHTSNGHIVPAIWGVKVNYFDRQDTAFERDVNHDGKKEPWERDRLLPKIGLVWENTGRPLADSEKFWVATIDYLAAGGDNTAHVFDQIPMSQRKYFEVGPRDLMAEYLRKHPGIAEPRQDIQRVNAH